MHCVALWSCSLQLPSSAIHTHTRSQYGTIVSLTDLFFVSNDDSFFFLINCLLFNTYLSGVGCFRVLLRYFEYGIIN